jgi:hypothetical protein
MECGSQLAFAAKSSCLSCMYMYVYMRIGYIDNIIIQSQYTSLIIISYNVKFSMSYDQQY